MKLGVKCELAKVLELREIKAWDKTEAHLGFHLLDWNLKKGV